MSWRLTNVKFPDVHFANHKFSVEFYFNPSQFENFKEQLDTYNLTIRWFTNFCRRSVYKNVEVQASSSTTSFKNCRLFRFFDSGPGTDIFNDMCRFQMSGTKIKSEILK